ncbi:D-alanine--D-alanine ligase [Candidatus Saccharibacteria bacterium]|nr:D-alanine--D-alanine ligase [Candidatus Saccharibacteria bacterium]
MKILLIFGGVGNEHEVSKMGAKNVLAALHKTKHQVTECEIKKDGTWSIPFDTLRSYDVIFPLIHGRGGEDGAIAALGELLNIPVVGCNLESSVICWDKRILKSILHLNKMPVVPWILLHRNIRIPSFNEIKRQFTKETILAGQLFNQSSFKPSLFVKPAREGSSFGVGLATTEAQFHKKVTEAFKFDNQVLIEKAIAGREFECAVLGNAPIVEVSDVGEVITPINDFYSYEQKYAANRKTVLDIPAQNLDAKARRQIQTYAQQAFNAISGRGLARVDFFLSNNGQIYINEINTMPGFTNTSMYPKLWEHAGLSYDQLVVKLIQLAKE